MEPNKIEKQFREKLNAREIQPSAQAWDRLDAMLSVAEEKKTRKPFGFLFIAASILVFVTLGLFLFTQNGTQINTTTTVVGTETKIDTVQNEKNKFQTPVINQNSKNQVAESDINTQKSNSSNQINQFQSSPEAQSNSLERSGKNQKTNTNQNQIIKDKSIEFQNSSDVAQKDLPRIIEQKEIIVKKPITLKSDDILLADLDKSAKESSNQISNLKVDAKSLLSQVDGEVEYTFRERMFNKVNKNYKEIKVALANRNNE